MPVELKVKIEDQKVKKLFSQLQSREKNLTPAMKLVGEIVQASVQRNFEVGGRPQKWKALSPVTIAERLKKKKWPGQILVRKGTAGGLLSTISYRAFNNRVEVSASGKYAAIHQFGGKAGRGQKVVIPARPYLMVQEDDRDEIKDTVHNYLLRGKS